MARSASLTRSCFANGSSAVLSSSAALDKEPKSCKPRISCIRERKQTTLHLRSLAWQKQFCFQYKLKPVQGVWRRSVQLLHLSRDSRAAPGRPLPPSDDAGTLPLGSASSRGRFRLAVGELACTRTCVRLRYLSLRKYAKAADCDHQRF